MKELKLPGQQKWLRGVRRRKGRRRESEDKKRGNKLVASGGLNCYIDRQSISRAGVETGRAYARFIRVLGTSGGDRRREDSSGITL